MLETIEKTEHKKGYKKTKLGWIPEDWEVAKLFELFNFTAGGDVNKTIFSRNKTKTHCYPIYSNSIEKKGLYGYSSKYTIDQEAITITGRGDIGRVFFHEPFFTPIGRLVTAIAKKNIDTKALSFFITQIKFRNESTGVPQLTVPQVQKYSIAYPTSKNEQEKIAEILSTWDDGIETLEKLIEQKEILKNSLAQKCFRRKNILFSLKQHKLGELFKNRKETNCCDLELLSVCDGLGIVPRSQLNAKDNSNDNKSKYLKVCIGDLAYNTMRMWQGRCGVSSYEGIVSPAYTVCIPKNNIDVDYMYYLFKTPHMIHDFWRYSQGIVDDTLNLKFNNFEVIKIWIPDKETQTNIAKLLKSYDEEIQLLNSKLEKLKEQKKGLMQKLLTGQIRVKV